MTSDVPPRPPTDRPPLDRAAVARLSPWRVEVLDETGSTNRVAADRARSGEPEGLVVVAEHQTAGRGRFDRRWESPPRAGLLLSVLLRPTVPDHRWSWLPLLAGVAVADALERLGVEGGGLKWPNDVLLDGRKVAGLLAERVETPSGPAAVLGIGLNVSTTPEELPVPEATSLAVAGPTPDRADVLAGVLEALDDRYQRWARRDHGEPLAEVDGGLRRWYEDRCASLGTRVRVQVPDRGSVEGTAVRLDDSGGLMVDVQGEELVVTAGDVVHLR